MHDQRSIDGTGITFDAVVLAIAVLVVAVPALILAMATRRIAAGRGSVSSSRPAILGVPSTTGLKAELFGDRGVVGRD